MNERPHTVAIGAFIVGALLIAMILGIFLFDSGFGRDRETVIMVFDSSVKGLNVGAPVALRGVRVGQVTDIELMLDSDNQDVIMLVEANLREEGIRGLRRGRGSLTEELISRGMRAQLNAQSLLTGLLYVQLDFHPNSELVLADVDSPYVQIPTIPNDLQRIARKLEDLDFSRLADAVSAAASGISTLVNSEAFQALPASIKASMDALAGLSEELRGQLATSLPKLDRVLDGAAVTVATVNTELPALSAQARAGLAVTSKALTAFEQTMLEIDSLVAPDSATQYQLNQALRELAQAGRSLQLLARTLEEQPEALLRGKSGDH